MSLLRFGLVVVLAVSAAACPRRIAIDVGPEGDVPDLDAPDRRDDDGDGLCNSTEATLGLDPAQSDTDGDGFPDVLEYSVGTDGRMIDSPARDALVFLSGVRDSVIDAPVTFSVRGSGETFTAAFASSPSFLPYPERDAATYYAGARAIGAVPMENVAAFDGETFIGVRSRVLLVYTITFRAAEDASDCMRIYPFLYQVQTTTDGRIHGQARRWLVVAPPGATPGRGEWCMPPIATGCR